MCFFNEYFRAYNSFIHSYVYYFVQQTTLVIKSVRHGMDPSGVIGLALMEQAE